ncbi:MAG: hypothetical protein ACTSQA_04750 [Candidatus Heimdallarchaeaceae archaeon]
MSINMKTKQILIIIGIILIIASIAGNLYFGGIKIKENIYKQGFDSGQINLANQIIQGRKITTDTGIILFVANQ